MEIIDSNDKWLDHPGKLIAALPALLGFVPESSLVLVTVRHGRPYCAMRADLADDPFGTVEHMADVAAGSRPQHAVLVIVDEEGAPCRLCNDDYRAISDRMRNALEGHGIVAWSALVVDRVAVGGRWHCVDGCGDNGPVDDPSSSPLAAAAVLSGRRLYTCRDELVDVVAPTDPARTAGVADLISSAEHDGGGRPDAAARDDVHHAMEAASDLAAGKAITDGSIARLAASFGDPRVRDTLYALCAGPSADRVEALWSMLARLLPPPWRAEALVLLAFSAYVRGDGTLAGISLEAAQECDPLHRMAGMLDQALRSGMTPEQIRELAHTGYRMAERIGVELPPMESFRRPAC